MTQTCISEVLANEYKIGENEMGDEEFYAVVFALDRKLSKIKNPDLQAGHEKLIEMLKSVIDKKTDDNELIYDNIEISLIMKLQLDKNEKLQKIFKVVTDKRCENDANLSSKNYRMLAMQKELLESKSDTYLEIVEQIKTMSKILNDNDILDRFIKAQGKSNE